MHDNQPEKALVITSNTEKNRALKARKRRSGKVGREIFSTSGAEVGSLVVITVSRGRDPITGIHRPLEIIEGYIVAVHKTFFILQPVGEGNETEQYFFKNLNEVDLSK